jgi:hypothetical protein
MKLKESEPSKRLKDSMMFSALHPKAICKCGHTGDGAQSQHTGFGGHGACIFDGGICCEKFTWSRWTPEYRRFMEERGHKI